MTAREITQRIESVQRRIQSQLTLRTERRRLESKVADALRERLQTAESRIATLEAQVITLNTKINSVRDQAAASIQTLADRVTVLEQASPPV